MKDQTDVFLSGEGDAWYLRNKEYIQQREHTDHILLKLKELQIHPKRILELGCASGYRLQELQKAFNADCYGIDPSDKAIEDGKKLYPNIHLSKIDAAGMSFDKDFFDLIIFGFSPVWCDRDDLFKIAYLADRSLQDLGHIAIYDFYSKIPYRNEYSHHDGLYSYKMKNADLFSWHPYYISLLEQIYNSSAKPWQSNDMNDITALSILKKRKQAAYIDNPYK